ncbi:ABC transporter substrate-binding protein [Anaerosporobacter sp.]|uniref:ABC transporter substrate-binding protein n=1 Tax=Anaerosporobacter sp. TaxID=1872529 RepID=UPI00286F2F09|nr:ABC transporter substrate-binding protein [Anaerosporobacter sp.]
MKKFKKVVALCLACTMVLSLAACGKSNPTNKKNNTTTKEDTTTDTAKDDVAKDDTTADTTTTEQVTIKMSWWGGDERHTATIDAVNKFMELNPDVKVEMDYGAWTGWEDKMSTAFYSKTAPDINQINWNWISSFSSDGSAFLDLNEVKDTLDLSKFAQPALDQCVVADSLQAVPVAMTGRIYYFNKTTFDKAGIAVPTSLEELKAAGQTFKDVLGDDFYPLVLGEYDRMILMVYYLESVYGKAWVENGTLNYTTDEIKAGIDFIQSLEDSHVTPSIQTILGDGAESLDKNPKWMEGTYAGIFEWDSSASKFKGALNEGQEFVVGDYFKDMGEYQGGFSKVSLAFAISKNTKYPEQCARLINFLLNEDEGVAIMGSQRGIPLSASALAYCQNNNLLDATVAEANAKILAWTQFQLDPTFEDAKLKGSDGTYYDAFQGLSYGDYDTAQAAQVLADGVNAVLGN